MSIDIWSYIASFPDDRDVIPDALDSLGEFSNKIFVLDTGFSSGTLCHHPRFLDPLAVSLLGRKLGEYNPDRVESEWNGVPLVLFESLFENPGHSRNVVYDYMLKEPNQPTWVCWIDADEVCSNEFIRDVRPFLESLSPDVTNVCPKWFTLIEDEQHYTPEYSSFLSHARIHHPNVAHFDEVWHEPMHYIGRRVDFDSYIVHTRMLFRRRLYVQRNHYIINEGAWAGVTSRPVPAGVTWKLHWPEGEPKGIKFSEDIREYIG